MYIPKYICIFLYNVTTDWISTYVLMNVYVYMYIWLVCIHLYIYIPILCCSVHCCRVLQSVAVRCSAVQVLQCVAVCCSNKVFEYRSFHTVLLQHRVAERRYIPILCCSVLYFYACLDENMFVCIYGWYVYMYIPILCYSLLYFYICLDEYGYIPTLCYYVLHVHICGCTHMCVCII